MTSAAAIKALRLSTGVNVVIVCLWVTLLSLSSFASDVKVSFSQYSHTGWRLPDGAFTGAPNSTAQTRDGYLWVGTEAGLFRFDGVRFLQWTDPVTGKRYENPIHTLVAASDGSLFIAGDGGMGKLQNGHLTTYKIAGRLNDLVEGADGEIWIARSRTTGPPLCRFSDGRSTCIGVSQNFECKYGLAIARGGDGVIWLADSGRVCSWDGNTGKAFPVLDAASKPVSESVNAVAVAKDGSVWIGLLSGPQRSGLLKLEHGAWKAAVMPGLDIAKLDVSTLRMDHSDGLWVGTVTQGLFHLHSGIFEHLDRSVGLTGDEVADVHEDREGTIWASTTGGVDRFHLLKISTLSKRDGLSADEVSGIAASSNQNLLISNLNALDMIRDDSTSISVTSLAVPGHKVTTSLLTSDGAQYLGLSDGLVQLEHGKLKKINAGGGTPLGMVRAIVEDRAKQVWVLCVPGLLYRLKADHTAELLRQTKDGRVLFLAADRTQGVWVLNDSLTLLHYVDGQAPAILSDLPKDRPFSIGTRNGGAISLSGKGGLHIVSGASRVTLSSENGLPCDTVYSSIEDRVGDTWLYALCGIIRIRKAEMAGFLKGGQKSVHFELFDSADGAQPGQPNFSQEVVQTLSGRLWFVNGHLLQTLDPSDLHTNAVPPPIQIQSLIADHKAYLINAAVYLPKNTRDVEIDYAGLSLASPREMTFRYKLSGVDHDWNDTTTRREAFFMNLPPGSYVFQVIGSNNDGVWNNTGATLRFVIPPTLIQTIWFRVFCVFAAIGLVLAVILYRLRAITRDIRSNLSERLFERERIARELHDTLLQGFQGLLLRFETATRRIPDGVPAREMMESALNRADEVLIEGRNRVRALRSDGMIIQDLQEAFEALGRTLKAEQPAEFSVSLEGAPRPLHPVVKDEAFWIGREAIMNSFVHSHAASIMTRISFEKNGLVLVWLDNGCGIDRTLLEVGREGHWGLRGMRERAVEIGASLEIVSEPNSGTSVELRVPASIAYEATNSRSWQQRLKACLLGEL